MKVIELKVTYDFYDIYNACFNTQTKDTLDKIIEQDKEDDFIELLQELMFEYEEDIYDYIYHDWEEIEDRLELNKKGE